MASPLNLAVLGKFSLFRGAPPSFVNLLAQGASGMATITDVGRSGERRERGGGSEHAPQITLDIRTYTKDHRGDLEPVCMHGEKKNNEVGRRTRRGRNSDCGFWDVDAIRELDVEHEVARSTFISRDVHVCDGETIVDSAVLRGARAHARRRTTT